ncbi:MAG TPA: hypothetical protein ENN09_01465, partial [Planctomycetes bacterium]|nr:hypothetical protein [Planctomycetota bacterium]
MSFAGKAGIPAAMLLLSFCAFHSQAADYSKAAAVIAGNQERLRGERVLIEVFGAPVRAFFDAADADAIHVRTPAGRFAVAWRDVKPLHLAGIALQAAGSFDELLIAARCAHDSGAADVLEKALARALSTAPARARDVEAFRKSLEAPPVDAPAQPVTTAPPREAPKAAPAKTETVRLPAVADIWLSDANNEERSSSAGRHPRFKLKSIQEMAAVRFDASAARGREVLNAALFLRRAGADMLRYIRVSTVNQDWEEGSTMQAYGPASGATYLFADSGSQKPWAWHGSVFADVIMSSGNTLAAWAERKELADGWISVPLPPELVYSLAVDDTDGLAIMDGGTISLHNNFIYSRETKGSEPYIEVE